MAKRHELKTPPVEAAEPNEDTTTMRQAITTNFVNPTNTRGPTENGYVGS